MGEEVCWTDVRRCQKEIVVSREVGGKKWLINDLHEPEDCQEQSSKGKEPIKRWKEEPDRRT